MDLIERFRYIMKLNNLTASAFANQIGVQASSVSHVLSGRNKPSLEFIQKVLSTYPKVDPNWLINGSTSIGKETNESNKPMQQGEVRPLSSKKANNAEKKIDKVLIFYVDGTFEEFKSSY